MWTKPSMAQLGCNQWQMVTLVDFWIDLLSLHPSCWPELRVYFDVFHLTHESCPTHQTFRLIQAVKLMGIMLKNRWWPTIFFFHYYSRRCRRMVSEVPGVIGPTLSRLGLILSYPRGLTLLDEFTIKICHNITHFCMVMFHSIFSMWYGPPLLTFMGRNLQNRTKLTLVQIMNNVGLNN